MNAYLKPLRRLAALVLLPLALLAPNVAKADVLSLLEGVAQTVGVWPSQLPTVTEIRAVVGVLEKCGSTADDNGLIACVEALIDNHTTSNLVEGAGMSTERVRMAIAIYLDLKNQDYVQLMLDGGKPLGCALAQVLTGIDVCGALDAILAVGGAVVDVVAAFLDGLTDAAEWLSCVVFGCSKSAPGPTIAERLFEFYKKTYAGQGLLTRWSPEARYWTDHLAELRRRGQENKEATTGLPILPWNAGESEIQQALTAYIAYVGDQWDAQLASTGVAREKEMRGAFREKASVPAMVKLFNAAPAAREAMAGEAKANCMSSDEFGRMIQIWRQERGQLKPGHMANNFLLPENFCTAWLNQVRAEAAWKERTKALEYKCTAQPGGSGFDTLSCTTYAGAAACRQAQAGIRSAGQQLGLASRPPELGCKEVASAAGPEFAEVLAGFDPQKRCAVQAGGSTVECSRDLSVPKACTKALDAYKGPYTPSNRPIVNVSCQLRRDAAYQALVDQTRNAAQQLAQMLQQQTEDAVKQYNAQQSNPALKIAAPQPLYGSVFEVSPDPLVIRVKYTQSTRQMLLDLVKRATPPLGTQDMSDPGNDGQDKPGYVEVREITPQEQAFMDQVHDVLEKRMKGMAATSGPGGGMGGPVTGAAVGNPVVNPALSQGMRNQAGNPALELAKGGAMQAQGATATAAVQSNAKGGVGLAGGLQGAAGAGAMAGGGAFAGVGVQQTHSLSLADQKQLQDAGCQPATGKPGVFACPTPKGQEVCKKMLADKKVAGCQ
jgi:hypothetical protein